MATSPSSISKCNPKLMPASERANRCGLRRTAEQICPEAAPAPPIRTAAPARSNAPAEAESATDRGLRIVRREMRCRQAATESNQHRRPQQTDRGNPRNPATRRQPETPAQHAVGDQDERAARQPRLALRREYDAQESFLVLEIPDQQHRGEHGEQQGNVARAQCRACDRPTIFPAPSRLPAPPAHPNRSTSSSNRPEPAIPRAARARRRRPPAHSLAARDYPADTDRAAAVHALIALRPHVNRFVARRRGHDRAFVGVDVIELGLRSLLGLAHAHRFARHQLRRFRSSDRSDLRR
jgi:hypothetical protein